MLPNSQLIPALKEVGVILEPNEINDLLLETSSEVDFDQFSLLAMRLRKSNEWSGLLLLHELLADSLPKKDGQHPLQVIGQLSAAEISGVCEAFSYGLRIVLQKSSEDLKKAFEKFDQVQEFEINEEERFNTASANPDVCDININDEVKKLNEHLGQLQKLLEFDSKIIIFRQMQAEHNDTSPFTVNGSEWTTPKAEWDIVLCSDSSKNNAEKGRKIPNLDSLLKEYSSDGLLLEEVIALVLYTGKMVSKSLLLFKLFLCPYQTF